MSGGSCRSTSLLSRSALAIDSRSAARFRRICSMSACHHSGCKLSWRMRCSMERLPCGADKIVSRRRASECVTLAVRNKASQALANAQVGNGRGIAAATRVLMGSRCDVRRGGSRGWDEAVLVSRCRGHEREVKVTEFLADDEPVAVSGLSGMLRGSSGGVGDAGDGESRYREYVRSSRRWSSDVRCRLLGTDVFRAPSISLRHVHHAIEHAPLRSSSRCCYLLKPFGPARLAAAMERVRASIGEPVSIDAVERLSGALAGGPITRLFVRVGSAIVPVAVERVSWFEADGDYVIAHAGPSRHMLHLALSRLEQRSRAKSRECIAPNREPRSVRASVRDRGDGRRSGLTARECRESRRARSCARWE